MSSGYDEFGFPLSAIGRLRQMQGIRPTETEFGYEPAPIIPDIVGDLGFTLVEYSQAVGENVIFDMFKGRR